MKVGVIIETKDGQMKKAVQGALSAAAGQEIYALVLEGDPAAIAPEAGQFGASQVVKLVGPDGEMAYNGQAWASAIAQACEKLGLEAVIGLASAQGRDLLPRLAAITDAAGVMDCMKVDLAAGQVVKSRFSGKMMATYQLTGKPWVIGVRPNAIEATEAPAQAAVQEMATTPETGGIVVSGVAAPAEKVVDLTEAEVIITGGRAIGSADNYGVLRDCAAVIDAAVGASRAAVDAGFAPHSMQVGQTGKTVSPKMYIACGVSGAIQHFAGMKTSDIIVAVNIDKDAPIFEKCDYGIIGDLFEVIPELTKQLQAAKG